MSVWIQLGGYVVSHPMPWGCLQCSQVACALYKLVRVMDGCFLFDTSKTVNLCFCTCCNLYNWLILSNYLLICISYSL